MRRDLTLDAMKKRLVIAGGSGFIGSALAAEWLAQGAKWWCSRARRGNGMTES